MLLKENQTFSPSNYFNFRKLLRIDLIEKFKSQTDGRAEFSKGKFLTLSHLRKCRGGGSRGRGGAIAPP